MWGCLQECGAPSAPPRPRQPPPHAPAGAPGRRARPRGCAAAAAPAAGCCRTRSTGTSSRSRHPAPSAQHGPARHGPAAALTPASRPAFPAASAAARAVTQSGGSAGGRRRAGSRRGRAADRTGQERSASPSIRPQPLCPSSRERGRSGAGPGPLGGQGRRAEAHKPSRELGGSVSSFIWLSFITLKFRFGQHGKVPKF